MILMSQFSIAMIAICVLNGVPLIVSGCAGELTEQDKETRDGGGSQTGGAGGSGGSGSGGSTGGSGGSGGNAEACVLALTASKACSISGCHGGSMPAAGLVLSDDVIRQ